MQLNLLPYHKNKFSLSGLLIRGVAVAQWLMEIQRMGGKPNTVYIYPVPGTAPNTIWGCFVTGLPDKIADIGIHQPCQQVTTRLYIPEKTNLTPAVTISELELLFPHHIHVFHPEFGLVALEEPLQLTDIISMPIVDSYSITTPAPAVLAPMEIRRFQISALSPEETIKQLEEKSFPANEPLPNKPLNLLEKLKLGLYKTFFSAASSTNGVTKDGGKKNWLEKLSSFIKPASKVGQFLQKMEQDFENLEERNKKKVDQLMDMLKNNPEEALKYAIPLDDNGSARGKSSQLFDFAKRWFDFSLFGNTATDNHGSGSVNLGSHYFELQEQYRKTAEQLERQQLYEKAAFVYMKLMKDYHKAAATLKAGKMYSEAATVHLKYTHNKHEAALCYEQGNMTMNAIELYKELEDNEKVGDLYKGLQMRKEAHVFYEKKVEQYTSKHQYVKASLVYRNKMNDAAASQQLLLKGWQNGADGFNCLNNYFENIEDTKELNSAIKRVYREDVSLNNSEVFLKAITYEYNKHQELSEPIKEMAYELIATHTADNPQLINKLKDFTPGDKQITKDILRYKEGVKRR